MNRIDLTFALLIACCLQATPAHADYTRIEQDHPSVSYTGNWTTYTGASLSGGSLVAAGVGATASITFSGTGVSWISYRSSSVRGSTRIYLDGVLLGSTQTTTGVIDFWIARWEKFRVGGLAGSPYNIEFAPQGQRTPTTASVFFRGA